MKAILAVCLVAMALTYTSANVRRLQVTATTVPTETALLSNFSNQTFMALGNYTLWNTNCTDMPGCVPTVSVTSNPANVTQILITVTYPTVTACGNKSGTTFTTPESPFLGLWNDTNTTSPLYTYFGALRLNNLTEIIYRNDTVTNLVCFQEWASAQSIQTNLTQTVTAPWAGVWALSQVVPGPAVTQCCAPDVPVLVIAGNTTLTVDVIYHLPNCTTCGTYAGQVVSRNVSIVGGGAEDEQDEMFFYLINSTTVITVNLNCAFVWEAVTNGTCYIPPV